MRRKYQLLLAACMFSLAVSSQVSDEHIMGSTGKIAHDYYRISPFNKDFSDFLIRLMNDPTLSQSKIIRKTDSTLFFLEGLYKTHRPFFFKPEKVKIILSEREVEIDQTGITKSMFLYQVVAYAAPGKEGSADVKNEYEKILRRYKKSFDMNNPRELKNGDTLTGEVRDFYFENVSFPTVSLAWSTDEQNGTLVAITIRFLVFDNRAFLPKAAYRL
jgi:hypothetical protein